MEVLLTRSLQLLVYLGNTWIFWSWKPVGRVSYRIRIISYQASEQRCESFPLLVKLNLSKFRKTPPMSRSYNYELMVISVWSLDMIWEDSKLTCNATSFRNIGKPLKQAPVAYHLKNLRTAGSSSDHYLHLRIGIQADWVLNRSANSSIRVLNLSLTYFMSLFAVWILHF